jgi:multisite-specific tRNA:(cytosine-C5)-methyltransferase
MYSVNLMLPKEDRRAMLLRLFNDETPVIHPPKFRAEETPTTDLTSDSQPESKEKSVAEAAAATADSEMTYAQIEEDIPPPVAKTEEDVIKAENIVRGQEQEDLMSARETYQRDGDEEDRFNTTV